jgi:methyltransferase (TIGR00027 family)
MKQDKPSHTAQHMALIRAAHQVLDKPLVMADPIALRLVGTDGLAEINAGGMKFNTRITRHLRAFAVARGRIVEDELALAVAKGVRQFVVLGAGFDTFAYRNPYVDKGVKVFEVDHPNTQALKRQKLFDAQIIVPESLTFVPVNFEKDELGTKLNDAGFQSSQASLFSWLGVSMYLPQVAIEQILRYVQTQAAPGSTIIFDYIAPLSSAPLLTQMRLRVLAGLLALKGEPWRTYFAPLELAALLKSIGFRESENMGYAAINAQFFNDRYDELKVGGPGNVMIART